MDKIDTEYQEKNAAVERLDSEISEKENIKAQTEAALAKKQAIFNESAHKVFKINYIDNIETGKTVFGGKVTTSPDDYDKLTDIAKKQIAAESRENSLQARITMLEMQSQTLTTEKEQLTEQNVQLRKENGELQLPSCGRSGIISRGSLTKLWNLSRTWGWRRNFKRFYTRSIEKNGNKQMWRLYVCLICFNIVL